MTFVDLKTKAITSDNLSRLNLFVTSSNFFKNTPLSSFSDIDLSSKGFTDSEKVNNLLVFISMLLDIKRANELKEEDLVSINAENNIRFSILGNDPFVLPIVSSELLSEDQIDQNNLLVIDALVIESESSISPAIYLKVFSEEESNFINDNLLLLINSLRNLEVDSTINFKADPSKNNSEVFLTKRIDDQTDLPIINIRLGTYFVGLFDAIDERLISNNSLKLKSISDAILNEESSIKNDKDKVDSLENVAKSIKISFDKLSNSSSFSALVKNNPRRFIADLSTMKVSDNQIKMNIDSKFSSDILNIEIVKDFIKSMNDCVHNIHSTYHLINDLNSEIYLDNQDNFSQKFIGLSPEQKLNILTKYNVICSLYSSCSLYLIKGVNMLTDLSPLINSDLFGIVDVDSIDSDTYLNTKIELNENTPYLLDVNISNESNDGSFAIPFDPTFGVENYFDCLNDNSIKFNLFDELDIMYSHKSIIDTGVNDKYIKSFEDDGIIVNSELNGIGFKKSVKKFFKFNKIGGALAISLDVAKLAMIIFALDFTFRSIKKISTEIGKCIGNNESPLFDCLSSIEFGLAFSESADESLSDLKIIAEKIADGIIFIGKKAVQGFWELLPNSVKFAVIGGVSFGVYRLISSYSKKDEDNE